MDPTVDVFFQISNTLLFLSAGIVVTLPTVGPLVVSSTQSLKSQLEARRPNRKGHSQLGNWLDTCSLSILII